MAKRIERDDLIDIPGYKEGIVDAQRTYRTFMDEAIQLTAELKKGITQTVAEIKDLRSINASGGMNTAQQNEAVERARALKQQYSDQKAAVEGLAKTQANYTATIAALEARQAKLIEQYQALEGAEGKAAQQRKRVGAELVSLAKQTDQLGKVNKANADSAQNVAGQYNKLQKELTEARRSLKLLDSAFDANTGAINKNNAEAVRLAGIIQKNDKLLRQADQTLSTHTRNVGNYPKAMGSIGSSMNSLIGLAGQLGLALSLADVITGVVSVRAEYEQLGKQLEVTLGSQSAAAAAQDRIADFANKTPRSIAEVTKAFSRLVDVGIVPTEKQLYQISDVAASKGKTLMDYVEAIADAQMGEFERLKEFGINAKKTGDDVAFTFKNQTTQVKFTTDAINDYLLSLGDVKGVSGQTEEAAKTLNGRWEIFKDTIKGTANSIGEFLQPALEKLLDLATRGTTKVKGFFDAVKLVNEQQGFMAAASLFVAPFSAQKRIDAAVQSKKEEDYRSGRLRDDETALDDVATATKAAAKANEVKRKAQADAEKAKKEGDKAKRKAEQDLRESLQKIQAQQQQDISGLDTQKGSMSDVDYLTKRLAIVQDAALKEQTILRKAGKENTAEYIAAQTKINEAAAEYIAKRGEIEEKAFKDALSKTKDAISSDTALTKAGLQERLTVLEDAYNKEEAAIKIAVAKRELTEEQGEKRLYDLKLTYLDDIQRAALAAADTAEQRAKARVEELRAQGKTEAQIADALALEKDAIDKAEADRKDASAKRDKERSGEVAQKEIEDAKKVAEVKKQIDEMKWQIAGQAISTFFDVSKGFREAELASLDTQKTRELAVVGDNAEAKAAIEKRFDQQSRELKRRQAIADKAAAAFQIGLSTAQGVANALSKVVTAPLVPFILALGALQLGAVLAAPIPEFYKGTQDAPEGPAWVAERGYELVESKQGGKSQYRLLAEKQVTYLNKHDRVYTHQETKRMLATNAELAQDVRSSPGGSLYQPTVVSGGASEDQVYRAVAKALAQMTWEKTTFDQNGVRRFTEKENNRTEWLNKRMSLPRRGK